MTTEPINPHDLFFKQYLSHPVAAADFLRNHLPATVVALVDLTRLELAKDSFVDEQLRNHFSDLVYRTVTTEETPVAFSLLFEHKSYPDEWVDFQVLRYEMRMWEQEFAEIQAAHKAAKQAQAKPGRLARVQTLTPILVLLVYHGKEEWHVSLRFARHLTGMQDPESPLAKALAPYVPDFEPHLVNLSALPDEEIQGEVVTRLFVLVLKHIFEQGLGGQLDEILSMAAEVLRQSNGIAMVVALLRYLGRAGVQVKKEEMAQKLLALLPKEGGSLMQTMAEEWIEEGKRFGRQEGRQESQRTTILRILQRRFQASEESLQGLAQQLTQISDEDVLYQLVDLALEVIVLPDFQTRLQGLSVASR
ncbi:MAG: Rpn family recombination-promoting nuclease/putative transposase [Caldilinea sp. CFX5]|nr:Rpn family recombination-promoting nuclease/putative transposase [Caldilinea sp. CFX5]